MDINPSTMVADRLQNSTLFAHRLALRATPNLNVLEFGGFLCLLDHTDFLVEFGLQSVQEIRDIVHVL